MITWTTPTLMITLKGMHIENASYAVTVTQGDTSYTFDSLEVETVGCNTILSISMTQEQTAALAPGIAKVQVNWIDGYGHRGATKIKSVSFGDNLLKEVL